MKIILNSQPFEVSTPKLDDALIELGFGGLRIATALNGEFIPQGLRPSTQLVDGDRLEVLTPMQGG